MRTKYFATALLLIITGLFCQAHEKSEEDRFKSLQNDKQYYTLCKYAAFSAGIDLSEQKFQGTGNEYLRLREKFAGLLIIGISLFLATILLFLLYIKKLKVRHKLLLTNIELSKKFVKVSKTVPKGKNKKSFETDIRDDKILERVVKCMIEKKSFLNPDIKISDVAREININEKYLSQAINNITDDNFNNLVNFFRVMYLKELLEDIKYSNYTIEALGQLAGFKHKATFYSAFSKHTGLTPGYYSIQISKLVDGRHIDFEND